MRLKILGAQQHIFKNHFPKFQHSRYVRNRGTYSLSISKLTIGLLYAPILSMSSGDSKGFVSASVNDGTMMERLHCGRF